MRFTRHTSPFVALVLAAALAFPPAALATEPANPMPLIAIDPGHGGPYSNANANGLREKDVNLAIALELERQLKAQGYRVIMTRTTDRAVGYGDRLTWNWNATAEKWAFASDRRTGYVSNIPKDDLQARCDVANRAGADLFISIHCNGAASRSARGTESYGSERDRLGRKLAQLVHNEIVERTGLHDRGAFAKDFYVCRWTNMPAVLVEGAFISNSSDATLLKSPRFRAKIAAGITAGVGSFFAAEPFDQRWIRTSAGSSGTFAAKVSRVEFPTGAPVAVVARADRWADAPAAPALAKRLGGPLLWVGASGVPSSTAIELARLKPQRIVTVGVNGSFDASCVAQLVAASSPATPSVTNVAGVDRYALSAAVATRITVPSSGHVLIADADDANTVLPAAAVAAKIGAPLLLVHDGALSAAQRAFLAANRPRLRQVALVGPRSRVPLSAAVGAPSVVRYAGSSLASNANKLNARYYTAYTAGTMKPRIADARFGTDYLVASLRAARRKQPLLPVAGARLPEFTREFITNRRVKIGAFEVLDGHNRIPLLMDHLLIKSDYI